VGMVGMGVGVGRRRVKSRGGERQMTTMAAGRSLGSCDGCGREDQARGTAGWDRKDGAKRIMEMDKSGKQAKKKVVKVDGRWR